MTKATQSPSTEVISTTELIHRIKNIGAKFDEKKGLIDVFKVVHQKYLDVVDIQDLSACQNYEDVAHDLLGQARSAFGICALSEQEMTFHLSHCEKDDYLIIVKENQPLKFHTVAKCVGEGKWSYIASPWMLGIPVYLTDGELVAELRDVPRYSVFDGEHDLENDLNIAYFNLTRKDDVIGFYRKIDLAGQMVLKSIKDKTLVRPFCPISLEKELGHIPIGHYLIIRKYHDTSVEESTPIAYRAGYNKWRYNVNWREDHENEDPSPFAKWSGGRLIKEESIRSVVRDNLSTHPLMIGKQISVQIYPNNERVETEIDCVILITEE